MNKLKNDDAVQPELISLIYQLQNELQSVSGKKVYGYLPRNVKKTVDKITALLAQNPVIAEMYQRWCELEHEKYLSYTNAVKILPRLVEQQSFKSIKNMIIRLTPEMDFNVPLPDDFQNINDAENEIPLSDIEESEEEQEDIGFEGNLFDAVKYYSESAELGNINAKYEYAKMLVEGNDIVSQDAPNEVELLKQAAEKNTNAVYYLGKLYFKGEFLEKNVPEAEKLFKSIAKDNKYAAYMLGRIYLDDENLRNVPEGMKLMEQAAEWNENAVYHLGKLYNEGELVEKDVPKSIELFSSIAGNNQYAAYRLGKIFATGNGVPGDPHEAVRWFEMSAEMGNEYAKWWIENINKWQRQSVESAVFSMLHSFAKLIQEDYSREWNGYRANTDRKLRRVIAEKKRAMGNVVNLRQNAR